MSLALAGQSVQSFQPASAMVSWEGPPEIDHSKPEGPSDRSRLRKLRREGHCLRIEVQLAHIADTVSHTDGVC